MRETIARFGGAMSGTTDARRALRRPRLTALIASIAAALMLISGSIAVSEKPAFAVEYPSWDDVLAARDNVSRQQSSIQEIRGLIAALADEAAAAQAVAEEKGAIYYEAQLAFDEAAFKADQLQAQADEAQATADESRTRAGQFVAELSRAGGGDLSASLFTNPGQAEALLSRLGYASKISEQAEGIYAVALADQNTAQSLSDQAAIARELREELRAEAEVAFEEAQAAAAAAAAAVAAQEENRNRLEAQLAVLEGELQTTEEQWEEGERVRKAEEERKKREAEEAARRAAEAAQRAAEEEARRQGQLANLGNANNAGQNVNGWANPVNGPITSHFGYRVHPLFGYVALHAGVDIGAPCGRQMYSVANGTVTYSGWNGGYGYYVRIDHGNGLTSGYGHIQPGGLQVSQGQQVGVGQPIALVGNTGNSGGCHLHLEIRDYGNALDPVPYLRNKGVSIG